MTEITGMFRGARSHEVEMPRSGIALPRRSKVSLAVISSLGLGCCGIDRCYMGSMCLGLVKGFTCGCLGIWAIVDYLIIVINMLQKADSINALGFEASFAQGADEIGTAFWIT